MNPHSPLRSQARATGLLLLFLAAQAAPAHQTDAAGLPDLAPELRAGLTRASRNTLLPQWQRDFMQRTARGGIVPAPIPRATAGSVVANATADGTWAEYIVGGLENHSAIYDPVRERMVVFGGLGRSGLHNDVWALSLAGTPVWTKLAPTGTPLSARRGHSAIYDPGHDRMVVFGGQGSSSYLNDVWALSLAGQPAWTKLLPTGTPPVTRYEQSAIYDPVRDRMVVFGGYNGSSLNDVWVLSLADTPAWTALTTTGSKPSGREGMAAIYDPVRDRVVVFGGLVDTSPHFVNEVWALSLAGAPEWTALAPAGIPPIGRYQHSAIYDQERDRLIVYGGDSGSAALNDVWALSLGDMPAWTGLEPAGAPSVAQSQHSAVYDPVRQRMVVFGGGHYSNDLWTLSLGNAPTWNELEPNGTPPSARRCHSASYDPVRERMLVFGGVGSGTFNDVWALSLTGTPVWTELTPAGTPPSPRSGHSMIYDPVRDRMVVFGGFDGSYLDDVWALSLAGTPTWTELTPGGTPPGGRRSHSAIYDPARDRMVVFGGVYGGANGTYFNDVWSLSLTGPPEWTPVSPSGTPPSPRSLHSAIYDPLRDRMVVFGGQLPGGTNALSDVWSLSLADAPTWSALTPAGTLPRSRYGHTATYDPVRDRMVVFAGTDYGWILNDAAGLSLGAAPAWTSLARLGEGPSVRCGHTAIYDPVDDCLVTFGGDNGYIFDDVWSLQWDAPVRLTCPPDTVWTPGASILVTYAIANVLGVAQTVEYALASERDWPGFPMSGSVELSANGTVPVSLSVPVPDSVATGKNQLTFRVTVPSLPRSALCSHYVGDATTPVLLSLVSQQADPNRVLLTWYAAGGSGVAATVYRRTVDEAWITLGQVSPAWNGLLLYEDRTVLPGRRYGYRLGLTDGGQESFGGETWVDVPIMPELSLGGARPNPATRDLAVAFALPSGAPARLEVFDLGGRRILAREVGSLGAGSHVIPLGAGRPLAPGVYQLRLTQGSRAITARAVIVR